MQIINLVHRQQLNLYIWNLKRKTCHQSFFLGTRANLNTMGNVLADTAERDRFDSGKQQGQEKSEREKILEADAAGELRWKSVQLIEPYEGPYRSGIAALRVYRSTPNNETLVRQTPLLGFEKCRAESAEVLGVFDTVSCELEPCGFSIYAPDFCYDSGQRVAIEASEHFEISNHWCGHG